MTTKNLLILDELIKSNKISQEAKTVKKKKKFGIKSITIEHPKTVTKLLKLRIQQILITHPNKIKVYADSKEADRTLQLDLIKKHNLPKKCFQQYEIKITVSKKHDEQLNLTRSSNKNKLFAISEEFRAFKFQQNLRIQFTKNDKVFKNKIFLIQ